MYYSCCRYYHYHYHYFSSIIYYTNWRSLSLTHSLQHTHTHTLSFFLYLSYLFLFYFPQIGESFEECAIREAKEETNLDLINMKLFHVTNNPNMDNDPNKHYITIFMKVRKHFFVFQLLLFYSSLFIACFLILVPICT